MGSLSDNGGGWPNDGGSPDDLPDLPEEWGVIVIPDDLSELTDEVNAVRAELELTRPRTRWQRFAARPAVRRLRRIGAAGMRAPVLIIALAVLVTLASLFASAWPGPSRSPATQRTANTNDDRSDTLPALELVGTDGKTVRVLRDPTGELRSGLRLGRPDGTAAAVLVNRGGEIVRKIGRTVSIEDLRPHLARI